MDAFTSHLLLSVLTAAMQIVEQMAVLYTQGMIILAALVIVMVVDANVQERKQ